MTKQVVFTDAAPAAVGPYSQAIIASGGKTVFLSGQIGLEPATGELVSENFEGQVRQAFANLEAVVKEAGANLGDIVKLTLFLTDLSRFASANAIMAGFAAGLSDQDKIDISHWLASQKATPGFAQNKDTIELGERIYRGGIADRNIAACAGCHSPNGAGIPAQYPRLSGQHADYTVAQLNTFRDGTRANSTQMTQVAAKLNDKEIKAVADYIAGLR